jgi:signal transduction histidine kinase/ActR/RegA family two-component response regulator
MRRPLPPWLLTPVFAEREKTRLARLAHACSIAMGAAALGFAVLSWLTLPNEYGRFVVAAVVVAVAVVAQVAMRRGHLRAATLILIVVAWAIPTLSALLRAEVHAAVVGVYLLVIPFAGVVFGPRVAGWTFMGTLASLAGLHVIVHHGAIAPSLTPSPFLRMTLQFATLGAGGGIFYVAVRRLYQALERTRRQEELLVQTRASLVAAANERDEAERARAELESRLNQAQKMESLGRLAGGVAHDFNNLLMIIDGNAKLAGVAAQPHAKHLDEIRSAADRAAALVRQLLAFSRQQVLEPQLVDAGAIVNDTKRMLGRLIGEHITLRLDVAAELPAVKVDRSQLQQVVMNLAVNAADAMPRGGDLGIELAIVELVNEERGIPTGNYVRLTVRDTGEGVPAEALPHIFEPFFTTKALGEATGLGLSMVHGVVTQSEGHIQVESELGRGTAVSVYLPSAGPLPADSERKPVSGAFRTGGKILIVEDEPGVRRVVRRILRRAGYDTIVVDNPLEALTWMVDAKEPPDLLLSDVVMPDMSGPELYRELDKRGLRLPVIFMSGYAGDVLDKHGGIPPGGRFLRKPFDSDELIELIARIFEERGEVTEPDVAASS